MITGNGKFSWRNMYLYALLLTKSKELISTIYKAIMHDQLCSGTSDSI